MSPTEAFAASWPFLVGVAELLAVLLATAHVVLRKDNVSSAIGWVGLIWLAPVVGPLLYLILGVNRIERRGRQRRPRPIVARTWDVETPELDERFARDPQLAPFLSVARVDNAFPITDGNALEPLVTGDVAYPAMVAAIARAQRSVVMATYIVDHDAAGAMFADALANAVARGVEVRVLIDAVGARYSTPSMVRTLRRRGVRTATFMPSFIPWTMPYWNLRNHRKLLVIDGGEGFVGGMNIRAACMLSVPTAHPTLDMHFHVCGPVVAHLAQVFAEDWAFATRERLAGPAFVSQPSAAGNILARGLPDGPDYDMERLLWKRLALISHARRRVRIVSPYFLPETRLLSALRLAVMRGVCVELVLPGDNNLRFVEWAATHQLSALVEVGCAIYLSAAPFDHTKLFVVDGTAVMIGSSNWDPRSHRLNFEFDLDCYDVAFAAAMDAVIDERIAASHRLTPEEYAQRGRLRRLRDGCAWLLSPYL